MSGPMFLGNLAGTGEHDFYLGDDTVGVRRVDGEAALYDPVSGQLKLSELAGVTVAGHPFKIDSGGSLTVPTDRQFDHIGRFKVDGRLVLNGRFTLGR